MSRRKDYIGPTIKKGKPAIIPEGPVAELTTKASKGMTAAKKMMGGEEELIEGVRVEAPLRMGPPVKLPPSLRKKIADANRAAKAKQGVESEVDHNVMLGNSHIGSIDTLLANDRMEKPRIKAWADDDSKKSN